MSHMPFKKEQSVNLMFIHQGSHHSSTVWYDSGVMVYHICYIDLHVGLSSGDTFGYVFSRWLEPPLAGFLCYKYMKDIIYTCPHKIFTPGFLNSDLEVTSI